MKSREELRADLAALDQEEKLANDAAKPAREALKPFDEAIFAIWERREILLEENEAVIAGKCLGCTKPLFEGDLACRYDEDGELLCEDCSPTLVEALENWRSSDGDAEDVEDAVARLTARLDAGESPDTKLVCPL